MVTLEAGWNAAVSTQDLYGDRDAAIRRRDAAALRLRTHVAEATAQIASLVARLDGHDRGA